MIFLKSSNILQKMHNFTQGFMRIFLKYAFAVVLCWVGVRASAQLTGAMFDVRHIGRNEGLSSERVFSIVEDNTGAIWIATKVGVDRYNGNTIKNYTIIGDLYYDAMAGRQIHLWHDRQSDALWAYDNTGRIYRYSHQNDSFEPYVLLSTYIENEIILNRICFDNDGRLWFGTASGLYRQTSGGVVEPIVSGKNVNDVICIGEWIYAGTTEGVFRLRYSRPDNVRQVIGGKEVQTLFWDATARELWIGTFDNGLWTASLTGEGLSAVASEEPVFLRPIRAIESYDQQTLLVGIDGGGVYSVDRKTKSVHLLLSTEDTADIFLRGNGTYTMARDRQGNIWVGSYSGGVSAAILSRDPITIMSHERHNSRSPVDNRINDIEDSSDGKVLWYATDNGVSIQNVALRQWRHVLKGNVTTSLCRGDRGEMWLGCYGDGVYILNSRGDVIRHLTQDEGLLTTNYVFQVKRDDKGDFWLAGLNGDLILLGPDGRLKRTYKLGRLIHSIEFPADGRVAAATVNGFSIVEVESGEIENYATFEEFVDKNASAFIVAMLFNDDGTVWLGTEGGGICLYNMETREIHVFTTRAGLPSNDVYSIERDGRDRLWVSTGSGLALIYDFKISNLNYIGAVDRAYNKSAFARLADGRFAYGSTTGAVFVSHNAIVATSYQAQLRFTGLTLDYADDERSLRPQVYDMLAHSDVKLDYRHNSFTASFEAINYRFQRDITYSYILEGYDGQWSAPSSEGIAHYSKVAPGQYTLRVHAQRQSNGEIISENAISLRIAEPWYNSVWAWVLYLCATMVLFYFMLQYSNNRIQKRHNEEKVRFFIDTAHNIRTPITLVIAPLEDLNKEPALSDKARSLLDLARSHADKLHTMTTQLLEFEKIDSGHKQVELMPVNVGEVLSEEVDRFRPFCDSKGLGLSLSLPEEEVFVMANTRVMEAVFDNLIYNACKYTDTGGKVALKLAFDIRKVTIEVADNGIGIPKKDRKHLFNYIHRAANVLSSQEGGMGFGLLQVHRIVKMLNGKISFSSEENRGTTFTITLPRTSAELPAEIQSLPVQEEYLTITTNAEEPRGERDTLLIVEDHEALRYYLCKTFENDYRILEAASGEEALACLEKEYPDLILSDVMMPGIQGDELCRIVKENPTTAGIPFILLTAKTDHDAQVEGLRKGADDYVSKPFSTEILKLKVWNFIENRKRAREQAMQGVARQVETGETTQEPDGDHGGLSDNDHEFVIKSTEIIMVNISNIDFSINDLCREMAMSRTLFYSRLKSLTGQAPQEFIRIIRLQKAAELLRQGHNVVDVAIATGFVNTKYFAVLFKKYFGIQPSKYQKSV
jgi:signal transduction histidine kinase/CheY-like chemotaxis protein/ligand-binding sensor domain-containing protein/AraC-like DNA-binding protein